MVTRFNFGDPITCHCWNDQRDQIALSLNDNKVNIYAFSGSYWETLDTLEEHELKITALDWCPANNKIVTCGEDRNAYVWTLYEEGWKPTLVLLRINRAAMCVRWSPKGNKFAVGSSAKLIAVCHFDEENDWWVSKHIKKSLKSTVVTVDWHPNNLLIAAGSTDFKTRIYLSIIPEIEDVAPTNLKFGHLLAEFTNEFGGWVHCVKFSPSGQSIAWCSHDSTLSVVNISQINMNSLQSNYDTLTVINERTPYLPFKSLQWLDESLLIYAGFDCYPILYRYLAQENRLVYLKKLENEATKQSEKSENGPSAMSKFRSMDKQAASQNETTLNSSHQNTINEIQKLDENPDKCLIFSTVGLDGFMIMWDLSYF